MPTKPDPADTRLLHVVSGALPGADEATISIVAACAGLLANVAYADRDFSTAERDQVARSLRTVQGMGEAEASAVLRALEADVVELSTVHSRRFCRHLVELGTRELRVHVLGMLVELAAADDGISFEEVSQLRQTTSALGLEQEDYNRLQAAHLASLTAGRGRTL